MGPRGMSGTDTTVLSVGQAPFLLQRFQKINGAFVITPDLYFSTLSIQTLLNLEL